MEGGSRVDGKRRSFRRAQSADRRRREKGPRGAGPRPGRGGVHTAGLRGLLGLRRTAPPPAAASCGGWGVGGRRSLRSGAELRV